MGNVEFGVALCEAAAENDHVARMHQELLTSQGSVSDSGLRISTGALRRRFGK